MQYRIANSKQFDRWVNERMAMGHDMIAIKGDPPEGMTYDDGDPVLNPVNVAWKDVQTGEIFSIQWEREIIHD